jgi:transposase-like protein
MKSYPPESKADAVALYLSDPARTYASVAQELGINRETLRLWVKEARANGAVGAKKAAPLRGRRVARYRPTTCWKRRTSSSRPGSGSWSSAREARLAVFKWITATTPTAARPGTTPEIRT